MILTPEIMTLNKDFCFLKIWDTTRVLSSLEKKKKKKEYLKEEKGKEENLYVLLT